VSSSKPGSPRRFPLPLEQVRGAPARGEARAELQRPQRTVHGAAADAARQRPPEGLGLDSAAVRRRMVERLRGLGVTDERVLAAFATVQRHRFVDSALVNQAYEDTSLPIGFGQTISKPSVVGQMLQALLHDWPPARAEGTGTHRRHESGPGAGPGASPPPGPVWRQVLEIGSGCGYQAALLACLARQVVSIERVGALADKARANLAAAGVRNVQVLHGDGRLGAPGLGPFDAIVSAAGGDELPEAWTAQLAIGGRLVAPGAELRPGAQALMIVERHPAVITRRMAGEVYFVPLKSGAE
jgi:protein-L-isoaspartate(D-aspartate) O-methyltransferase